MGHIPNIDAISGALITLSLSILILIFVIRLKLYRNGHWTLKVEIYAEKNPWTKNVQKSTQLLRGQIIWKMRFEVTLGCQNFKRQNSENESLG